MMFLVRFKVGDEIVGTAMVHGRSVLDVLSADVRIFDRDTAACIDGLCIERVTEEENKR